MSIAHRGAWTDLYIEREWRDARVAFEGYLVLELEPRFHDRAVYRDLVALSTRIRVGRGYARRQAIRSLAAFAERDRFKDATAADVLRRHAQALMAAAEMMQEAEHDLLR